MEVIRVFTEVIRTFMEVIRTFMDGIRTFIEAIRAFMDNNSNDLPLCATCIGYIQIECYKMIFEILF
jgi:hypothetical protein